MKNRLVTLTLAVVIIASLAIVGCAKPGPSPATAWEWPKLLTICTQQQQSPMYALSVGWGSLLEKDTGTSVRVTPEEIGSLRLRNVGSGKYDISVEEGAGVRMTLEGIAEHATKDGGPFPIRVLWPNFLSAQTIMVRGDSDIKTMDDLKPGMNVAVHPGAGPHQTLMALLSWAELDEEDVNIIEFGDMVSAMRSVVDGKTDCCANDPGHPANFELEGNPYGIRFLGVNPALDPEAAARLLEIQPTSAFGTPVLCCKSAEGVWVIKQVMFNLVTESADPELTYRLAKWLDENFDAYKEVHPGTICMSIETFRDVLDTNFLPIHEGVIKYLKEKGLWTAADDKRQAYNVDLVSKYCNAYKAAIAEAESKGIKIDPMDEAWMKLWAEYKKDLPVFRTMTEIP